MTFTPYVAKDRHFRDFHFDFHIANETSKSWYDGSQQQSMPEREWCVSRIKAGMTIVDCGAHHGMLSLIFANAVGPSGKVFAYEALPSNAQVALENVRLNRFENVTVRPVGVGSSNSHAKVKVNSSNTIVLENDDAAQCGEDEAIQIVRLDDDLEPETKVDFVKIDVEGHELQALRGMSRVLQQRPIIDLELHNFIFADRLGTLSQILALLNQLIGYSWEMLGEIGDRPVSLGQPLELRQINGFDNPHLFGVPSTA